MFGRFCRRSRIMYFSAFIISLFIIYKFVCTFVTNDSNNAENDPLCYKMSKKATNDLLNLAKKIDAIAQSLNITRFLCYGTLWGALRHAKMLPWKTDFDFCILNKDVMQFDEVFFRRQFSKQALTIDYDSANGVYALMNDDGRVGARDDDGKSPPVVNMYVFEEIPEMKIFRRIGFKNRLLPPTSENIGSFPSRLAKAPLPFVKLNGRKFHVAREGIEIQKYHYKDNWWTEIKPQKCSNAKSKQVEPTVKNSV